MLTASLFVASRPHTPICSAARPRPAPPPAQVAPTHLGLAGGGSEQGQQQQQQQQQPGKLLAVAERISPRSMRAPAGRSHHTVSYHAPSRSVVVFGGGSS